ncbi:MAG: hypothetical protein U5K74_05240 [Gemmatimonadaceae bacterium]|nr:hypothetical protein [Gemmatimonadaceae bacterium]
MRRALQVQGVAFAGLALLVALGTSVLPAVPRKAELWSSPY